MACFAIPKAILRSLNESAAMNPLALTLTLVLDARSALDAMILGLILAAIWSTHANISRLARGFDSNTDRSLRSSGILMLRSFFSSAL
jgi:hypothetical protein